MILMIQLAQAAREIRLESLDDGPGILPFRLGPTRLITHYHAFIQPIRLDDIQDKINMIRYQIQEFVTKLPNDTYLLYELQINYLTDKLDDVIENLRSLEPSRAKRGLLDGLGSIIKSITGNLDHSDAIKYNEILKNLNSNQDKIVAEVNHHISLSKDWMTQHSDILTQLVKNQGDINTTLELLLDRESSNENSLIKYAKFAQSLTIISENTDDLLSELHRIEDILAFVRISSTHHSMLSITVLKNMLSKIRSLYGIDRILDLDIREYYNIIKPGSYFMGKQLVIVLKFPIISISTFNLYRLALAPNKNNQVLLPPHPYIATEGKSFMYIEAECPKVETWYLCRESLNHRIRSKDDCVHNLITNQFLHSRCNLTTVELRREAMEQLNDQNYVVFFPKPTKVQLSCDGDNYDKLQGSFLITIPLHCLLRTEELTIVNENDRVDGQPLKLKKITYDLKIQAKSSPRLQVNSIDLKSLHSIQEKIMLQTLIETNSVDSNSLYHTTIPLYSVMFGALVLGSIVLILRRLSKNKKNQDKICKENHNYDEIEKPSPRNHPATFSMKI